MKNLADFKRRLKVGVELEATNTRYGYMGIRKVSIVQNNSFALETLKNGEIINSWCEFPKAKDFEVIDENTVNIFWGEGINRELILTYKFLTSK